MTTLGVVQYIVGYAWPAYECNQCGCRFTHHDDAVYNQLHQSGTISYYRDYKHMALEAKRLFDAGQVDRLRLFLMGWSKYRFVMDEVDAAPPDARVLEVGASRGYLTSYFILRRRDVLGVDVSSEAIESANAAFGERFALLGSEAMEAKAPYDIIYHVGMIGCVSDPIALTRRLVAMLKPGGRLLFNAPNLAACRKTGQLWFESAPPPDLVTLFPPGFWHREFGRRLEVIEEVERHDADCSFMLSLRRYTARGEGAREDHPSHEGVRPVIADVFRQWVERAVGKVSSVTRLSRLVERWPTEFGLFVKMKAL